MLSRVLILLVLVIASARAQSTDVLIEVDRGRTSGIFSKSAVFQRAILIKSKKPTDTALLVFRGVPGYAMIESVKDRHRNLPSFIRLHQRLYLQEGISLVVMDCPTDQWGSRGDYLPTSCLDRYRSSKEHADDVRSVLARLRDEHGLSKFYVLGHSQGTISSRWLARNLGVEISGSIHSASVNIPSTKGFADSMPGFPYDTIKTPILHVHNELDSCRGTPYELVTKYAGENLLTVRGGIAEGDPCGGGHLHSYQGIEEIVAKAVIAWIKTGKTERVVGE